ncbi:hypothetical protein [Streptococcus suis]|uniref:DUF5648 domain-containing protein n=1 Tax=Streptococcus suis TaxID=1307 RepID=A0A0Z8I478_STRSU|nr:hypothetical protein [Streptococcus suis]CYV28526.1 Uncharacterised protein [Streptococcus suis]HEP1806251.1 hypothetical protein [Streptococcus suis]
MKFNKKAILFAATLATSVLVSVAASADTVIHRTYYPGNGAHLWTSDTNEVNVLTTSRGWKNEGVAWVSPDKGETVTRLYNPVLKKHLYTKDQNEVKVLTSQHGYRNEGQVFKSGGSTPIYRLYNPKLSPVASHHYTTDKNEYDTLAAKHGWKKEGVAFYANGKHLPSAPAQSGSTNPSGNTKPSTSTGTQTRPSKPGTSTGTHAQPSSTKPSQPGTSTGSSTSTSTGSSTQTQPAKPVQPTTPTTTPDKQFTRYTEIYNGSRKLERGEGSLTIYPDRTVQNGGYEIYQDQNGNLYSYEPGNPINGSEYHAMGRAENGHVRNITVNDWATWDKANQLQANIYANQAAIQDYWMKRVTEIRQAEGRTITAENSKTDWSASMLAFSKARIEEQRNVGSYYGWSNRAGSMTAAHARPVSGAAVSIQALIPENANVNFNNPDDPILRSVAEFSTGAGDLTYAQALDYRTIIDTALEQFKTSPKHWAGIMGSELPSFLTIGIYPNQNGTYSTVVHVHAM